MPEKMLNQIIFKMSHFFRMNGPPFLTIDFDRYVDEYVALGHERCDALYPHGGPRSGPQEDEELTTRASKLSAIYNV